MLRHRPHAVQECDAGQQNGHAEEDLPPGNLVTRPGHGDATVPAPRRRTLTGRSCRDLARQRLAQGADVVQLDAAAAADHLDALADAVLGELDEVVGRDRGCLGLVAMGGDVVVPFRLRIDAERALPLALDDE